MQFLLQDHNRYRKYPVVWCSELEALAHRQLTECWTTKKIQHGNVPPKGFQNIASGKKNLLKPEVVLRMWLADAGHAKPIQDPRIKKIGSAYDIDAENNVIVVCNYSYE